MKTNIKEFLKKHQAHQQLALEACQKIINESIFEMYKRIIDRTPVGDPSLWNYPAPPGYVPGTLKASWGLSFQNTGRNALGQFVSGAQISNANGISLRINSPNKALGATIYNTQPYAQRVEEGWSTQAPSGMMRITVAEYTTIIDNNAARYRIK